MVHLSETAGVGSHVTQDDMSPAVWEQLLQLSVCAGGGDIVTGQEAGTIQRRDVQQIDANNGTTW